MVRHQLQVQCRPAKARRSETDVLYHWATRPTGKWWKVTDISDTDQSSALTTPFWTLKPSWYLTCGLLMRTSTTGAQETSFSLAIVWCLAACHGYNTDTVTTGVYHVSYYKCQSSTTSTVVKAPLVRASLVKRRYIKYLALPFFGRHFTSAPRYLTNLWRPLSEGEGCHHLHFVVHGLLYVPCYEFPTYGKRSFSYAGPATWNSLPEHLRIFRPTLISFNCSVKTHFYAQMTHRAHQRLLVIVGYISWHFTYLLTYISQSAMWHSP